MTIWFASGNVHKKAELAAILNNQGVTCNVLIPQDAGLEFAPEETETSFHGNALLKAQALYSLLNRHSADASPPLFKPGDPIIADDSGICVDALGGRPGVYSARYGGTITTPERNAMLLKELGSTANRTARFVCSMVLLFSPDRFVIAQETCEGEIVASIEQARGAGGFGYDPILFIPELGRTVAELSEAEKNTVSHRAKAGKVIATVLKCQS